MRVIMTKGPQSPAVLCMTPSTPEHSRKCTMYESSAVQVRPTGTGNPALTPSKGPSVDWI